MASIVDRIKSQFSARKKAEVEVEPPDYSVLFVCMGNICRSPTVEGVFRQVAARELPGHVAGSRLGQLNSHLIKKFLTNKFS